MFDKIVSGLQAHMSERISSPLLGSFVISWCIWNYRFFVILLFSGDAIKAFELIETVVFPDATTVVLKGLVLPCLTAAAYIFAYPYPARVVFEFSRKRQREITEIRRRIEDETPLTLEESRKIRAETARVEFEHAKEVDERNREIERLKAEIASLLKKSTSERPSTGDEQHMERGQFRVLRLIESKNGVAAENWLLAQGGKSRLRNEFYLGELQAQGLVSKRFNDEVQDYVYEFTQAGRGYLLRNAGKK